MPTVDNRIIETLKRQQLVTEYIIYPFSDIENYQINLSSVPSFSQEDVLVVSNNKILSHWAESKGSVWVKIPKLIKNTPLKIYTLTGNPSAITASNGKNVFIFFDDFSTDKGYTLNGGSYSVANGVLSYTGVSNGRGGIAPTTQLAETNYIVEAKMYAVDKGGAAAHGWAGVTGYQTAVAGFTGDLAFAGYSSSAYKVGAENIAVDTTSTTITFTFSNYYLIKGVFFSTNITAVYNRTTSANYGSQPFPAGGYFGIQTYDADAVVDWFFVRKYISVEPIIIKTRTLNKSLLLKELMR